MKKTLSLLLVLVLCLPLCACAQQTPTENQTTLPSTEPLRNDTIPANDLIMKDLREALSIKNEHATITGVETVKSLTEDNSFSITLSMNAATKYADWTYELGIKYTKYDQGWFADEVKWNSEHYILCRVPDAEDIVEIVTKDVEESTQVVVANNSDLLINQENAVCTYDDLETQIVDFCWISGSELKHATATYIISSSWEYDVLNDSWLNRYGYDITRSGTQPKNVDFTGTWYFRDLYKIGAVINQYTDAWKNSPTIITNCTEDSFDLYNPLLGEETIHFFKTDDYPAFGNRALYYTDGSSLYINFDFQEEYTRISIAGAPSYTLLAETGIIVELPTI